MSHIARSGMACYVSAMGEIWQQVAPYVVDGLIAIIVAAVPAAVAWLRVQRQRLVAEQAAAEAEAEGYRQGLGGAEKKALAVELSRSRMGPLVRPSAARLDTLVEESVPAARRSVRPPAK